MALIMKSKPVVDAIRDAIVPRVAQLKECGITPTLGIVRVGDRPDDLSYERTAIKRAESLGIATQVFALDAQVSEEDLLEQLRIINDTTAINGCLMFRPLPEFIDEKRVCDALVIHKDIDGISTASLGAVFSDDPQVFAPCTAEACLTMLDHYDIPVAGKHVVVVGRSLVIGKPVAMLLLKRNASVTMCHSRTEDLRSLTRQADIVVCATGRPKAFDHTYFSAGQTVIDVGISFDDEGNLCGDVDFDDVEPLVGALTPVPGGIGSVTTSVTMEHTVRAAEQQAGE